jgi:uncharacterized protein with GYD domain
MAKYLIQASYTEQGLKGLLKEGGTARRKAVEQAAKAMGGTLELFYYAFGEKDAVVIVDYPDNVTATAAALVVGVAGTSKVTTTVLITPEEVDQATELAMKKGAEYRPPGK